MSVCVCIDVGFIVCMRFGGEPQTVGVKDYSRSTTNTSDQQWCLGVGT